MNKQKHRWSLNFTKSNKSERSDVLSPPGYNSNHGYIQNEGSREVDNNLIVKKSWEIALAPLKQIPMNLFIMYMAGNSISILPIMMVGMLFLGPIKAIFSFNKTFKLIEGNQAIMQKLIYIIGNLAGIALALYKCKSMGLLPTHPSDWLDFVEPPQRIEFSGGGLIT
ncbi:ER membrane protein complex subunit 4 [Dermatophagoides farinae]|uniref:ER membrane protein complex subunit 4 n=1 Tax=Dermatophagoides farinae TaxID=6954 RepID=A0A922IGQ5_DERFA|nr:transmembrane protein 85-like protein [Dermatophagoides farinae]KAH9529589.1 ER membrane protein complex subunit 4 [Dermatophagoides farinae]